MAKTRQDRQRELQRMEPHALRRLYDKLYGIPAGEEPDPGIFLIQWILAKAFPEQTDDSAGRGQGP